MSRYTKFLIALLGGLASWGATAAPDYNEADLWGLCAIVATSLAVFQFPNTPPNGEPSDPEISEKGASDVAVLVLGLLFVLVILAVVGVL